MAEVKQAIVAHDVVMEAFQWLPARQQQLLLWHRVDGLTYQEMAVRLGVTERKLVRRMAAMIVAFSRNVEKIERSKKRSAFAFVHAETRRSATPG
ncbi:MAG TPA: sigma-70 region 4 domain-containing protein [Sphingomonadaceae bacterium]|nr:sigma-70 region 4 domain-containing protein [Sphingomonadaceae bacterium]